MRIENQFKKKVCVFTIGFADPTQGGSGIFNYYLLKKLIEKKYVIDVYFRKDKIFYKEKINTKFFLKIKKNINRVYYVNENPFNKFYYFFLFGFPLLKYLHQYEVCRKTINKIKPEYHAYISFDLGWAIALSLKNFSNVLCILGDPRHLTLFAKHKNIISFVSIINLIKAKSMGLTSVISKIGKMFALSKILVASFSIQHAKEYTNKGMKCLTLDWFSEIVKKSTSKFKRYYNLKKNIKFLHVGDLSTTASSNDQLYDIENICRILVKKNINKVEFNFVGSFKEKKISNYNNIDFIYTGRKEDLLSIFSKSDIYLYLKNYSVGTRTRIITAMSYGIPIIAHISVTEGLYRLKNRHDIILINSLNEFSKVIDDLIINPYILSKIGINARRTWEKYYNPEKNIPLLLKKINL